MPSDHKNHYSLLETSDNQSVKDFFSRPRLIASGDITPGPGNLATNSIRNYGDFVTIFGAVAGDRLQGIAGFRCTLRYTIVLTATPFHQGVLAFAFQYGTHNNVPDNDGRGKYIPLTVNLPHVIGDLAENTMVSLDVPYVSGFEYFALANDNSASTNYGTWWLNKLTSPRVVAGQNAPTYNVYLSLHDLELIGVAPIERSSVVLQSGATQPTGSATPVHTVQRSHGHSRVEDEHKKSGIASTLLRDASRVAATASRIPSLSVVGGSTAWFLRSASNALSSFGFSKPNDETIPTRMFRQSYAGDSQIDVPNIGYVASPFQTNKLAISPALGCEDQDQMAFDYVLTKRSYIFRGSMSDVNGPSALLYGTLVCPMHFWYRDFESAGTPTGNIAMPVNSTLTTNAFLPSTLAYVASNFRYWRGSLKFTIKFSKTKMHGGRVLLTYTPDYTLVPSNTPASNTIPTPQVSGTFVQPQGLSTIVDLKDNSEFEFVVPYTSPLNYTSINSGIGSFTMHVVNRLVFPSVASNIVDFMVMVSAEPDFEFAGIAPSLLDGGGNGTLAVLQDGVGGVEVADDTSQLAIGERFRSLKQVIMVPDYACVDVANNSNPEFVLTPWFKWNPFPISIPLGDSVSRLYFAAKSSRIARMYSFVNGATSQTVFVDGGSATNIALTVGQKGNDSGAAVTGFGNMYNRGTNFYSSVTMPENVGAFKTIIPTYSRFVRIPVIASVNSGGWGSGQGDIASDPGGYSNEFTSVQSSLRIRNNSGSARRIIIGRAAADDARASQFIGPPPCMLFPSTKTNNPSSGANTIF